MNGKVILVTGAAGSIGREISLQLARLDVKRLILFDNAETPMHNLKLELTRAYPNLDFEPIVGDVRALTRVKWVFDKYNPQIVFHAAAYKHVPMMESNPCEAIRVNVMGSINVENCAKAHGVEKFVMVSTDKAVNPTNVMGASKRIAEIYTQYLNEKDKGTKFITTRFGNVLGSNGSVIPLFKKQIEAGGPVTVTHPDIIRYFMTIPEACRLVLQAAAMGNGGEIFLFDMGEQVRIVDLARRMISLSGFVPDKDIKIEYSGLRPGEKLYEELLADKELTQATTHQKIHISSNTDYQHSETFKEDIEQLIDFAERIEVKNTVRVMKKIVPEFISKNSVFEELDE